MICPHCEYEHGWSSASMTNIEGKKEDFYTFPISMSRANPYVYQKEEARMYACPSCKKMFIED